MVYLEVNSLVHELLKLLRLGNWHGCTVQVLKVFSLFLLWQKLFLILQMLHWQFDKINSSPKQQLGEEYPPRSLLIFSHCKPFGPLCCSRIMLLLVLEQKLGNGTHLHRAYLWPHFVAMQSNFKRSVKPRGPEGLVQRAGHEHSAAPETFLGLLVGPNY